MRKTKRLLLWLSAALVLLTACTSKTEAPAVMLAKAAPSENNAKGITQSSAVPKLYTNNKLSFSFTVPDSWETGNYTVVTTNETMPGDGTKYTKADFLFQDDKNSPLLTILLVPDNWWKKTKGERWSRRPCSSGKREISFTALPCRKTAPTMWVQRLTFTTAWLCRTATSPTVLKF